MKVRSKSLLQIPVAICRIVSVLILLRLIMLPTNEPVGLGFMFAVSAALIYLLLDVTLLSGKKIG